jgi:hypothetical protein
MYCRVLNWISTDVSEVRAASIIRAMRQCSTFQKTSRHLRNKKREYLKDRINELESNSKNKNI